MTSPVAGKNVGMKRRARFAWLPVIKPAKSRRWLPDEPVVPKPPAVPPLQKGWPTQQEINALLDGFCPEPQPEEQIAVSSKGLILFLRLSDIEWVETGAHGVDLHVGTSTHRLRAGAAAVQAKLPPNRFLRLSSSTLANREQIREVRPRGLGEYEVLLRSGTRLTVARDHVRAAVEALGKTSKVQRLMRALRALRRQDRE